MIEFQKEFICGNFPPEEVGKTIVSFGSEDVVVVTAVVGSLVQVKSIVSQYETEERTFGFIKVSKEGYIVVREIEPDYTYKSPVTGNEILMSDYFYEDKKPRCIVSECPGGELIRFWVKGEPVYFKLGN